MIIKSSEIFDFLTARLPVRPAVYFLLFFVWTVTLYFLSSGNPGPKEEIDIPHIDKVAHFIYFLFGGASLAAFGGLKWPSLSQIGLFGIVFLVCCIIGRLDEYHQSFTVGRTGNDLGDWVADTLGGAVGAWVVISSLLPRWGKAGRKCKM